MNTPETVLVMDGGMGHELRRRGIEVKGAIGTVERFLGVALANTKQPDIVEAAHRAYIDAGAHIIVTNNYACVPGTIGADVVTHIAAAGKVARAAVSGTKSIVAGSLPPLKASYRPDLVAPEEEMARDYRTIAEALVPYSDVLVCETMSTAREAAAACHAGLATGKPVWVAWALSEKCDGTILSGETIEEAVAALGEEALLEGTGVAACLFNCSQVEATDVALPRLRAVLPSHIKIGAYANGFQTVGADGKGGCASEYRKDMTPEVYAMAASRWAKDHGASIIGGCCGIFPEHIQALAAELADVQSAKL